MDKLNPIEIDPNTFLSQNSSLPALPRVTTQIQEAMQSDNVDTGSLVNLIQSDPALVAQILKIVNSAYYGFQREIADMKFAVAYLGLNEVHRIVLSLSVINTFSIKEKGELDQFWFHSFYTALCSKHLAKKFEPLLLSDELWPAAILHDIGKLVYLKFFPNHYKELRKYSHKNMCLFSDAEKHFSLPTSAYLGLLLCDHWRLPAKIRGACEFHGLEDIVSTEEDKPVNSFRRIICLSNLVTILAIDELNNDIKHKIADTVRENMGYSESEFLTLMGEIYELKLDVQKLKS